MKSEHLRTVFCFLVVLQLIYLMPIHAELYLNEYLSVNVSINMDEDNDFSDWIELYNSGPLAVNLSDYSLSDDETPFEWLFPEITLPVDKQILIFASGKDRGLFAFHWETVIDRGDYWKYRVNTSAPPLEWRAVGFDDSAWSSGPTGIGYGDSDDATTIPNCISCCLRKTVVIDDPASIRCLALHVDYDDAFVAYINGTEIARANIISDGAPAWNQNADSAIEPLIVSGFQPSCYALAIPPALLVPGMNVVAICVHNASLSSSDMTIIPWLSLGSDLPPEGASGPAAFIAGSLPQLHTNFSLAMEDEQVRLYSPGGELIDQTQAVEMRADISRGRNPDGGTAWNYQLQPTPGESNENSGCPEFSAPPVFDVPGGLYNTLQLPIELSASQGALITYTLDGSVPTESSTPYLDPIQLFATSVIRARVFEPGLCASRIISQSYILNDPSTLMVASFVTDPDNLWDPDTGIHYGDNYLQEWERPIHLELYESDGTLACNVEAGVKISGNASRAYPQKSLGIYLRNQYGSEAIDYPVFLEKSIPEFKRLVFRNAGQDWCKTSIRDALSHRFSIGSGLDRLAYHPSRCYINGEYWGLLNIREKAGKHCLAENHNLDPDEIDYLMNKSDVVEGSADHYEAMISYIESHDLSVPANYAYVGTQMDIDNFTAYMIFEIFAANTDWPGNNIKYWRPQTPAGRWKWILQDLDLALYNIYHNSLEAALAVDGPGWPNPPWSTFLLRSLMTNTDFRQSFINSFADHLNSSFLPDRTIAIKDELRSGIETEMARHLERWDGDPSIWQYYMDYQYAAFFTQRPNVVRSHLRDYFSLGESYTLSLDPLPHSSGAVKLSAIEVDSTWSGTYFTSHPMTLTAVPRPGYQFDHWSDPSLPAEVEITIAPSSDYSLIAFFTEGDPPDTLIAINEINYHSHDDHDSGDWLELHNYGSTAVDLSGWVIKDENDSHSFALPPDTYLESNQYLVICENLAQFQTFFPAVEPLCGNIEFGFSGNGELIRLFDSSGSLFDYVEYDDESPWPTEPDGGGPTLELTVPAADNALPENWSASPGFGSPGEANSPVAMVPPSVNQITALSLGRPFPNPTTGKTIISFNVPERGKIRLVVFDVAGRCVTSLIDKEMDCGHYDIAWSSAGESDQRLSPGIYFIQLQTDKKTVSRRILLAR